MKFSKGHAKVGGRRKGTPNKSKLEKTAELLAREGLHPVAEVVRILTGGLLKPKDEAFLWVELLKFCEGKPLSAGKDEAGFNPEEYAPVSTSDLLKLVKDNTEGA